MQLVLSISLMFGPMAALLNASVLRPHVPHKDTRIPIIIRLRNILGGKLRQ